MLASGFQHQRQVAQPHLCPRSGSRETDADGGIFREKMAAAFPEVSDYCYIVPSYSIHRIQETHATAVHIIWDLVHIALGAEDVT
jgi:hypothetical protein